jgi:hypothetical protein
MLWRIGLMLTAGVLVVVAAGCGGSGGTSKPFTAQGTAPCLKTKGFSKVTTNPVKVGFIAGFADYGGVRGTAKNPSNVLTIAFAADDAAAVTSTKAAFTQHAPKKLRPHINDIMESEGNAVLVWTVTPTQAQLDDVKGCLHS